MTASRAAPTAAPALPLLRPQTGVAPGSPGLAESAATGALRASMPCAASAAAAASTARTDQAGPTAAPSAVTAPRFDWPAAQVGAVMSTRVGGVSRAPWASLNLGRTVGDDADAVAENRRRFAGCLDGARPVWLRQVHGREVVRLGIDTAEHPQAPADDLRVWLGPCIGARHFEVGAEVLHAFGVEPGLRDAPHFAFTPRADGSPRWHADLPALAIARLQAAGVHQVRGSGVCTYSDAARFYSHRRDGTTGRMAASIWRR